jgi:hypothetical protein
VEGGKNSWYRLNIPFVKNKVEYINPVSGTKILEEMLSHTSGDFMLDGPDYENDLAIRINRVD